MSNDIDFIDEDGTQWTRTSNYKTLRAQLAASQARDAELMAHVERLRGYLERLACLGNGTRHGNSVGNVLAQEALAATPAQSLAAITDPLNAHIERLKRALEMPCDRWSKKQHEIVKEVLESTPAQSLARLRNEVLEEAALVAYEHGANLSTAAIRAMKEPEQ